MRSASERLLGLVQRDSPIAQGARFLFASGCNTLFGYLVFAGLLLAGAAPVGALAGSTVAGVAFNYQTSRRIVFGSPRANGAVRFCALYTALLIVNWAALTALKSAGVGPLAAQAALILPMAAVSFLGQRTVVFGPRPLTSR